MLGRFLIANTIYRRGFTFEEMLAEEMADIGPLIAVGSPGEKLPPFGADRLYLSSMDWRGAVRRLMDDAALIIVVVADTDNIRWEIREIYKRNHLSKTVFIIPPLGGRGVKRCMKGISQMEVFSEEMTSFDWRKRTNILCILFPTTKQTLFVCGDNRTQWAYEAAGDVVAAVVRNRGLENWGNLVGVMY
jgi:hypothetical protein